MLNDAFLCECGVCFLSMATLSEMFQLELPTVHSIISKMIINEELMVLAVNTNLSFFFKVVLI